MDHGKTDVLCVLNRQRAESKDQRADMCTGRSSVLSPRTSVLICVLMDSHCNNPYEPINFWSRKIPLDQFLVGSTRINKNKDRPGRLISRRDCLVVERPSLDSLVES